MHSVSMRCQLCPAGSASCSRTQSSCCFSQTVFKQCHARWLTGVCALHPCRLEFASVVQLEAEGPTACVIGVSKVTKMKPNMADVPYVVERHKSSSWVFALTYAKLDSFMPLAQEQLVISRLPAADR
eukprot:GHRQ01034312.1.p4 GENE.GHRQ01034312.1~~GHRQ01034312.1.p4  ORF type:complete len:127 (-),score=34.72 GHRQ01034312.1:85-465(-)